MVPDGSVLTNVTGVVFIFSNSLLESLGTAFEGTEEIGGPFQLDSNPSLETIDNFNVLASVISVSIQFNEGLLEIAGFEALETTGSLTIIGNNNLQSITGFQSLETLTGNLQIQTNALLTSIAGLGNLRNVEGSVFLSGLDNLPNLNELTSLETVTGTCSITPQSLLDNAPQNVQDACA